MDNTSRLSQTLQLIDINIMQKYQCSQDALKEIEQAIKLLYRSPKIARLPFRRVMPVLKKLSADQNKLGIVDRINGGEENKEYSVGYYINIVRTLERFENMD